VHSVTRCGNPQPELTLHCSLRYSPCAVDHVAPKRRRVCHGNAGCGIWSRQRDRESYPHHSSGATSLQQQQQCGKGMVHRMAAPRAHRNGDALRRSACRARSTALPGGCSESPLGTGERPPLRQQRLNERRRLSVVGPLNARSATVGQPQVLPVVIGGRRGNVKIRPHVVDLEAKCCVRNTTPDPLTTVWHASVRL
jgi:hypothetical protein